jgi:hypothetical protein
MLLSRAIASKIMSAMAGQSEDNHPDAVVLDTFPIRSSGTTAIEENMCRKDGEEVQQSQGRGPERAAAAWGGHNREKQQTAREVRKSS